MAVKVDLRDYQIKAIEAVKESMEKGEESGLLYLATGLGKTVIASALAKEINKKTLFIVHREELAIQTLKKMLIVYPEATIGIVQGQHNQLGRKVTIASIQTLTVEKRLNQVLENGNYDLIIVDECFPKGTLIDGKPIETLKVGDLVSSFNHKTNQIELRPIKTLFKNKAQELVKIKTKFGKEIICTLNHPFYTRNSYIPAFLLKKGDLLYVNKFNNQLQDLSERISNDSNKNETLLPVYRLFQSNKVCFLQSGMSEKKTFSNIIRKNERNKFKKKRYSFRKNEKKQSIIQSRSSRENKQYIENNETQTQNTRWQWERINNTSTNIVKSTWSGLGSRIYNQNEGLYLGQLSNTLQNRFSVSDEENSDRSRWEQSQSKNQTRTRFKKRDFLTKDWVESIEVLEQGNNRGYSNLSEQDYVYNIEVEHNHNYFANGFLVHNCHHYSSGEWKAVLDKFTGYKIGLTATPNRSDNVNLNTTFNRILYRYSIIEGIKNKHLVDIQGIRYKINANFSELSMQNGDYQTSALSGLMANPEIVMETYKAWEQYAKEKKTIVFCVSIEHVNILTDYFLSKGVNAKSIIGDTKSDERAKIYSDFETGKIQVLISCMVLTEGFDCLDTETEVLTPNGWKNHKTIKNETECYSFNLINNNIEISNIDRFIERELNPDEQMIMFKNQHYNIRTTENHNFFVKYRNNGNISDKWLEKSALELSERKSVFGLILSGNEINKSDINLSENELKIIAWFLTDGYLSKTNRFFIYQNENSPYCIEIENLLSSLGWDFTKRKKINKKGFKENTIMIEYGVPLGEAINIKRKGFKHLKQYFIKTLSRDLLNMSKKQFIIFWNELLKGDGCKQTNKKQESYWLCNENKEFIDNIQELAVRCGFATNYLKSTTPQGKDFYYVHIREKQIMFTQSYNTKNKNQPFIYIDKKNENEIVWCLSNKNKTLITRRNGKVAIIGNCPEIECVLGARPTVSESLYIQMVGRGLRKYPNKEKCLVIDLVGNSGKHRLMQLGILFGLDHAKKEKAEKLAKEYGIEPEYSEDWETIESVMSVIGTGEQISLQTYDSDRKFEWIETEKGLVLSLGYKYGFILIEKEDGINFHKIIHYYSQSWKDKKDELADGLPLDWAISISEKEAMRFLSYDTKLIDRNSDWRNTPPSEKQIELLKKFNITTIPETKGKAGELITKILTMEKINGYNLATNTEQGKNMIENLNKLIEKEELTVKLGKKKIENLSYNEVNKILLFHHKNLEK